MWTFALICNRWADGVTWVVLVACSWNDKLLKGKSLASPTDGLLVPPSASSSPLLPTSKSTCTPTLSPARSSTLPPPSSSTSIAESALTSSVSPSPSPCPVHVHHFDLVSPTEETVKCDQCDQIFLSGHCLRFHTESFHMNIPPPQCQECGQGVHYYDCSNLNFPYLEWASRLRQWSCIITLWSWKIMFGCWP